MKMSPADWDAYYRVLSLMLALMMYAAIRQLRARARQIEKRRDVLPRSPLLEHYIRPIKEQMESPSPFRAQEWVGPTWEKLLPDAAHRRVSFPDSMPTYIDTDRSAVMSASMPVYIARSTCNIMKPGWPEHDFAPPLPGGERVCRKCGEEIT